MNTIIDRMYPNMSAAELSSIILKGKGKMNFNLISLTHLTLSSND